MPEAGHCEAAAEPSGALPSLGSPTDQGVVAPVSSGGLAGLGAAACLYVMAGLPRAAWFRFGWWMVIGLAFYFLYGHRHSRLRQRPPEAVQRAS